MWLCHSRPFLFSVGRAFGAALLLLYGCVTAIAFSPQAAPPAWLSPLLLGGAGVGFPLSPPPLSPLRFPFSVGRAFGARWGFSAGLASGAALLPLRGDSITASFPTTHKKKRAASPPVFHPLFVLMLLCLLRMWLYHSHPYLSFCSSV